MTGDTPRPGPRRYVVSHVTGDNEISTASGLPQFLSAMVTARNSADESVEYRTPLAAQPRIGDIAEIPEINHLEGPSQ